MPNLPPLRLVFGGIDPGLKGALAVVDQRGRILLLERTPIIGTLSKPRDYDEPAMHALLWRVRCLRPEAHVRIGLERPAKGSDGFYNVRLHDNVGWWRSALQGHGIEYDEWAPRTWQAGRSAKYKRGKGRAANKAASIAACKATWPDVCLVPPNGYVDCDGLADALNIAEYTRVQYLQRLAAMIAGAKGGE